MNYFIHMTGCHTTQQLKHVPFNLQRWEFHAIFHHFTYFLIKIHLYILKDEIHHIFANDDIDERNDVFVLDIRENSYFSYSCYRYPLSFNLHLHPLKCYELSRFYVDAHVDFTVSAFSNLFDLIKSLTFQLIYIGNRVLIYHLIN